MTRVYALRKLLEHGGLTFGEIRVITGWPVRQCARTLEYLMLWGWVDRIGPRQHSVYCLCDGGLQ